MLVWKWDGAALVWWAKLEDGTEVQARKRFRGGRAHHDSWIARVALAGGSPPWESGRHHDGADAAQAEALAYAHARVTDGR